MVSTKSVLKSVRQLLPDVTFVADQDFAWNPEQKTIYYSIDDPDFAARLLHEAGHASLKHTDFKKDIQLVEIERDAWQKAEQLAEEIGLKIDKSVIQAHLDGYRDWLHARSLCPDCQQNGIQSGDNIYKCILCGKYWRVNDARRCELRRYKLK